jgi:metallo-beta-lactamase family protein
MPVTVQFCGAARTVTGSCHLFRTPTARVLVDCGMFQGPKTLKALNYRAFPFRPEEIDAVLLTHAHIDHSGLLPKLVREGFRGRILATPGTIDLCSYLLPDAGGIQEMEVSALNRRNVARGRDAVSPIYTKVDAIASLDAFRPVRYETWVEAARGVRARYWNAGHILGSASIEIEFAVEEGAPPIRMLMSGDIGPDSRLLQPDAEAPSGFDHVVMESTYGGIDRPAVTAAERRSRLAEVVTTAVSQGGALVIPAFAVERTQELLVDLVRVMDSGDAPKVPIFIDSPLAIRATDVFRQHAGSLGEGVDLAGALESSNLRFTETADESKAIGRITSPHVIIAASGMCDAGRIRHHLKHWLWNRRATVLLVGFQARGTLGRFLAEGAKAVRIQGEEIKVAARIRRLDDYSGHADGPALAQWLAARQPVRAGVFLVHGEDEAPQNLSERIAGAMPPRSKVIIPYLDETYELSAQAVTESVGPAGPRLPREAVVSLDWHNAMSRLILEMAERLDKAADDHAREAIIRKMRAVLDDASR